MTPIETMEPVRRREERESVRFVWTTAGRVRRLTAPDGARTAPASRILESLARFEPAPRPTHLLLK